MTTWSACGSGSGRVRSSITLSPEQNITSGLPLLAVGVCDVATATEEEFGCCQAGDGTAVRDDAPTVVATSDTVRCGVKAPGALPLGDSCSRGSECRDRWTTARPSSSRTSAMTPASTPLERTDGIVRPEPHRGVDVIGCGHTMQDGGPCLVGDDRQRSRYDKTRRVIDEVRGYTGLDRERHRRTGRSGSELATAIAVVAAGSMQRSRRTTGVPPSAADSARAVRPRVTRRTDPSGSVARVMVSRCPLDVDAGPFDEGIELCRGTGERDVERRALPVRPERVTTDGRRSSRRSRARSCDRGDQRRRARPGRARARTAGRS